MCQLPFSCSFSHPFFLCVCDFVILYMSLSSQRPAVTPETFLSDKTPLSASVAVATFCYDNFLGYTTIASILRVDSSLE